MKKTIFYLGLLVFPFFSIGQQTSNNSLLVPDTIKAIIPTDKQTLLKDMNLYFQTRSSFESNSSGSAFKMNLFRMDLKGNIHRNVYFRVRYRMAVAGYSNGIDNTPGATDMAFVRVKIGKKANLSFGKLCMLIGGYEFDLNPIDIIQYNDILGNHKSGFTSGAVFSYLVAEKQALSFQVANTGIFKFEGNFGNNVPSDVKPTKSPMALAAMWNGSFLDGKFETIYSYNFYNYGRNAKTNYLVLGNKFQTKKTIVYYDFQYTTDQLDRTGLTTKAFGGERKKDASAFENWFRVEHLVAPKVNLLLTVMNSNQYWDGNPLKSEKKAYTSYGIIPTIQYLPYKNIDLRFFVSYIGRKYDYETYTGISDYKTSQINFGFIAPLLVL